jgi:CBS-domain-containing membrane protein
MENPGLSGKAKRVRIYVNEGDLHGHQPIHVAILAYLRKEGASGATVMRAIEGFGASGELHTFRFADIVQRLPIVIEWIERADLVERLLSRIKAMVKRGLITVEETEVEFYRVSPVRDVSSLLCASDVMSREVVSVGPDSTVRDVVELMLGKTYRAVPVVDSGVLVGIVTNSDLICRGGLAMRMQLLQALDTPELHAELERLSQGVKNVAGVMTPKPVAIRPSLPLPQVAKLMAHRRLKRLPVVDEQGALVGMVSRLDILRTAVRSFEQQTERNPVEIGLGVDTPVTRIMRTDMPMVYPDTGIPQILQAVTSTRLNRCLVVDHERHVLGKITDAEVLDRVTRALRPSALRSLIHRLPFVHPKPEEPEIEQHAKARTAADLMVEIATVPENTSVREAIAAMLSGNKKLVAVVDAEKHLVGILDRADMLHGLVTESADAK